MSNKVTTLILVSIFLLSVFLVTIFLQPEDILSNSPIYTDDYSMHFSQCLSAKRFISSFGKCWGYDPFFLAGFPRGALVNADNKAWELLFFIFSPLSEGFAFKLYLILFLLLYPFFVYAAARNFNLSRESSVTASILAILLFYLSIAIDYVFCGMLSYVFMCYFSIYIFSLFYKLIQRFTLKRYFTLVFLSSLLLLMHILSPVHLLIPILIAYALHYRQLSSSHHLLMVLLVAMVILLNSFWLLPIAQFFQEKTVRPENYNFLQIDNIFEPINVYIKQKQSTLIRRSPALNNTFIEVILLLFGLCGFYTWLREKRLKLLLPFLGGVFSVFIIAYYGSHTDLFPQLQPQRFTIPLNILLLIPCSVGIQLTICHIFQGKSVTASLFICSIVFVFIVGPVIKPLKGIYTYKLYRLSCEFPAPAKELLDWLGENTNREGRILIEDSEFEAGHQGHQYYKAHLPALFPEFVKREYLCGPRPMYPIKHSYASFTRGLLFERKIEDYSLKELKHYFEIYNVKWIVCWFEKSKGFFNQYPEYIIKMAEIDKFTIYQVNRKPSFFLKGKGVAKSDYNRLELNQIVAEDSEVIISYHFMEGLKTNPERKLKRVFLGNDPIGFIRIPDPPRSLVVYNEYKPR
jgi:hypothetical protein